MSRPNRRPAPPESGQRATSGDGGYSVVEAAITLPVIILLVLLVVQYALLWHGRHVAESAAREGLEAARGYQAPPTAGPDTARAFLHDIAPTLLRDPRVHVTRTPVTIRVQVDAQVLRVIPIGHYPISESAQGPIERFIAAGPTPKEPTAELAGLPSGPAGVAAKVR